MLNKLNVNFAILIRLKRAGYHDLRGLFLVVFGRNLCYKHPILTNWIQVMNETEYHRLADALLAQLEQILEPADQSGLIELESGKDMLTIELEDGKQFIVSKHNASKQVWLSSPVSGGLHFTYDATNKEWCLADQRPVVKYVLFACVE